MDNLSEVIFFHSLEESDALDPKEMHEKLQRQREPILSGRISDHYLKDTAPLQPYGGVGEENIPLRYRNFTTRIAEGIKEAADVPGGFTAVFYPLSGVDVSTVIPLLSSNSKLITLDSTYPFGAGYRPNPEEANEVDRIMMQNNALEKATHGMHSVELQRDGFSIAAELQLAGFNPERDKYRVLEEKISSVEQDGAFKRPRKKTTMELIMGGKRIVWSHYQMILTTESLSRTEPNQEEIWNELQHALHDIYNEGNSLTLSKAGMFQHIAPYAVAQSGLMKPGNYICIDQCDEPSQVMPGIGLQQLSLDNLSDIKPQFEDDFIQKHKIVYPYIYFGYQSDPTNIYLARVVS